MDYVFWFGGENGKKLYDLMDWAEIETIVYSEHDHPENILGPHKVKGGVLFKRFCPMQRLFLSEVRKVECSYR